MSHASSEKPEKAMLAIPKDRTREALKAPPPQPALTAPVPAYLDRQPGDDMQIEDFESQDG